MKVFFSLIYNLHCFTYTTYNVKEYNKTELTSFAKEKKNYKENINSYIRQKGWKVSGVDKGKSLEKKPPEVQRLASLISRGLRSR